MENKSEMLVTEFILLGFSYNLQTKIVLFVSLVTVYLVALYANGLFIIVTLTDARLHTPMYFFLCNLSFLDLCFSSVNAPTVLEGLLVERSIISFSRCITQMYIGLSLGQTECFLLAVMAWDRYVAICKPLQYQQIITNQVCVKIASAIWAGGFLFSLACLVVLPAAHFCGQNIIDHAFCEPEAVGQLACIDIKLLAPMLSLISLVSPLSFILYSYFQIIFTILRMTTADTKQRAFATCGSHMVVVTLFFGTAMLIYLMPKSIAQSERRKSMSVFYCLVVPALNPLIYTLRNKEVVSSLKNVYKRNIFCQGFRA